MRFHVVHSPAQRVKLIGKQVKAALRDPEELEIFRRIVINEMIRNCGDRDDLCQVTAVWQWWRRNVAYLPDPIGLDLYATPLETIRAGGGDCDDHVIGVDASLAMIGFPVGARVIQTVPELGGEWHVYSLIGVPRAGNTQMLPVDTTWPESTGPGSEIGADRCRYRKDWVFDLR